MNLHNIFKNYKQTLNKANFASFIYPVLAGVFGAIFFGYFYNEIFLPAQIGWITTDGWDTFQHYIGWEMFRLSPWTFPIGISQFLAYPVGVPIIYNDAIPLLAIPLKLFRSVLPETFQYLGLWTFSVFVLQGITSFYFIKLFLKKNILALLGSLFFIASPIIMFRIGGHAALCGHWLLLLSLYLLLRPHKLLQYWQWPVTLLLALLVHPYLFFMVGIIMVADLIQLLFVNRTVNLWQVFLFLFFEIILVLLIAYITGMFYVGDVTAVSGFGVFSMNLNAFLNPAWSIKWSKILPILPTAKYQYEGFNYLGVGIISLLLFGFLRLVINRGYKYYQDFFKKYWPVVCLSLFLLLIALSNHIFWGSHEVFSFNLPKSIENLLDIVRGSGRFAWPVYYLLFLLALLSVRNYKTKVAVLILVMALGVQFYDISAHLAWEQNKYENKVFVSNLTDPIWSEFAKVYSQVSFIPHARLALPDLTSLSIWAVKNKKTLNEGFSARQIKGGGEYLAQEIGNVLEGKFDPDTLYIFTESPEKYSQNVGLNDWLGVVDGYTVLAPGFKKLKN